MVSFRLVFRTLLVAALASFAAYSQGTGSRISGTVSDTTGGVLVGAKVTITDVDRGVARQLTTDTGGSYLAPNLSPGSYLVRVEYTGFRAVDRRDIVLQVGQELSIDVTMQAGDQTQTVTVTGEVPPINTTSAVLGGSLGPGTIQDLPLNGRNFMNLLSLRPGVTISPGGGAWSQTTNGLRPEHNVYLLDGITAIEPLGGQSTINSVSLAGDSATILPLETIQEFATQQNPKAEFGWKPGSITSIALKSGTNSYHGTLNAYGRTEVLDARNAYLSGDQKQEIALQSFGGTFGGPIKRDKLFFFGSYEGQRYSVGNPAHFFYPTMDPSAGPIAGLTSSVIGACNNVRRSGLALSPTSLKMAGLDANCARTNGYSIFDLTSAFRRIGNGAEVTGNLNTDYSVDGFLGKVDYNLNEKHNLNFKYFYGQHSGSVVNASTIAQPYWRPSDKARVNFAGMQWNYVATSSLFNSVRLGYNYFYQQFENADCPGSNGGQPDYGIPFGYNTPPVCGFTNVTLNGFDGQIGCCANFAKYYGPDHIGEVIDNLSYLRGRHSFKFGGEFRRSQATSVGTYLRGRGQVTFASGGTFGGVPFTTLENMMAGLTSGNGQIFIGDPRRNLLTKAYAAFVQDDWRIHPRLMLNLGLRYEYVPPFTEGDNRLSNFIVGQGFTQLGKNTDRIFNPDRNNFAPRVGFAWDMKGNSRTVLRGGASMMYVNPGWWIFVSQQGQNNPITGLTTNPSGLTLCRGAVNLTGAGCAAGVTADPTVGTIASTGLPLPPAAAAGAQSGQVNWNQTASVYGGNIYPSTTDTGFLKCGTNRFCTAQATDPNLRNAYVFSWNLGVQHAITNSLSLDMGYVGNHAAKLLALNYTNTPFYGSAYCIGYTAEQRAAVTALGGTCPGAITAATNGNAIAAQVGRPLNALYPYLSYIYRVENMNFSNYNGLQTVVTQRLSKGLSATIGYTFAHALDQATGERGGPNGTPYDIRHDYSNSDFDIRHRFTATATYQLPGKKGYGQLLEGWKLTSIVTLQSALPWGILGSRGGGNDASGTQEFNDTWNFYGDPSDFSGLKRDSVPYYTGAQAVNVSECTAKAGPPGSLGYVALQKYGCFVRDGSVLIPPSIGGRGNAVRNMFRGNGIRIWDASIMKDFKFGERVNAQFRIESFNLLNKTQFGNPQFNGGGGNLPFASPQQFGQSQITPDVGNNNPSLGSGGPREFQLGLKLSF